MDFSEESKLELLFQLMLQMCKFFGILKSGYGGKNLFLMVISGHFLAALNSFEFLFVDMPQDFLFDFLLQNRLYSFALESFHDLDLLI